MNKDTIMSVLHQTKNWMKDKSPEITLIGGLISIVGGTILLCQASRKSDAVIDEHRKAIAEIHANKEANPDIPEKEYQDTLKKRYVKTAGKLALLYGPGILAEASGMAAICTSHGILKKREKGLTAALSTSIIALNEYRARVKKAVGEDAELRIYNGTETEKISIERTDEEGVKTKEEKEIEKSTEESVCRKTYDRLFCYKRDGREGFADCGTAAWNPNGDSNYWFLVGAERALNTKLKAEKVVFLNDAYDALGMPKIPEGQYLGWVLADNNAFGENRISFGLEKLHQMREQGYISSDTGLEYWLSFNIDSAPVIGRIPSPKWVNKKKSK